MRAKWRLVSMIIAHLCWTTKVKHPDVGTTDAFADDHSTTPPDAGDAAGVGPCGQSEGPDHEKYRVTYETCLTTSGWTT